MAPRAGGLAVAIAAIASSCAPAAATPVVDLIPQSPASPPPMTEACDRAARHRARVAPLLVEGRLDRAVRVIALADKLCRASSAESDRDRSAALEELEAPPPPGGGQALLRAGIEAKRARKGVEAQRLLDRALWAIEREARATPGMEDARVALDVPNGISDTLRAAAWGRIGTSPYLAVVHEKGVSIVDTETWMERGDLRHPHDVSTIAVGPDGRTLASGSSDGLRLWDVESGKQTFFHQGGLSEVAWSRDGKILVAADPSGRVIEIRSPGESSPRRVIHPSAPAGRPLAEIDSIAVSAAGETVGAVFRDGRVAAFRIADGKELWKVNGHKERPLASVWSPDGKLLATAGRDGVKLWSLAGGRAVRTLATSHASSVAWSPDGTAVVTSDSSHAVWWSLATGKELRRAGGTSPRSLAFDPGGTWLAAAGVGKVVVWDAATGAERHRIQVHAEAVQAVAWMPGGASFVTGGWDDSIRIWDAATGAPLRMFVDEDSVMAVAPSPDGKVLASGSTGAKTTIWDAASGEKIHTVEGSSGWNNAVAFSRSGRLLASASDKVVTLLEVGSYRVLRTLAPAQDEVTSVAVSPDERMVAVGARDSMLRLFDAATGRELASHNLGNTVSGLVFRADGAFLLASANEPTLLDPGGGSLKLVRELDGHEGYVDTAVFGPDGTLVASGASDASIRLWNTASGELVRKIDGHTGIVRSVAFRPDGRWILSGSEDGSVRLWATEGARSVALRGVAGSRDAYAFTAGVDGRIEFFGEAGRAFPACRIGTKGYPFDLCRERVELPGLVAHVLAGDEILLDP